uniref:Uncharacterized protein n=1 Tax=Oryza sativa subsp. japonica TaxID=39947 RepID=Q6ESF1_ORYSJ|nr:hypothetical protein [Oryza sativa Japonica Group]
MASRRASGGVAGAEGVTGGATASGGWWAVGGRTAGRGAAGGGRSKGAVGGSGAVAAGEPPLLFGPPAGRGASEPSVALAARAAQWMGPSVIVDRAPLRLLPSSPRRRWQGRPARGSAACGRRRSVSWSGGRRIAASAASLMAPSAALLPDGRWREKRERRGAASAARDEGGERRRRRLVERRREDDERGVEALGDVVPVRAEGVRVVGGGGTDGGVDGVFQGAAALLAFTRTGGAPVGGRRRPWPPPLSELACSAAHPRRPLPGKESERGEGKKREKGEGRREE